MDVWINRLTERWMNGGTVSKETMLKEPTIRTNGYNRIRLSCLPFGRDGPVVERFSVDGRLGQKNSDRLHLSALDRHVQRCGANERICDDSPPSRTMMEVATTVTRSMLLSTKRHVTATQPRTVVNTWPIHLPLLPFLREGYPTPYGTKHVANSFTVVAFSTWKLPNPVRYRTRQQFIYRCCPSRRRRQVGRRSPAVRWWSSRGCWLQPCAAPSCGACPRHSPQNRPGAARETTKSDQACLRATSLPTPSLKLALTLTQPLPKP